MRKLAAIILLSICAYAQQDIFQQTYSPFVQFRNIPWGSGSGAMNNTFWFNSLAPEFGVCVAVYNQNPTNSHSFTLVVSQASDPATGGFTGVPLQWVTVTGGQAVFPVTLPANTSTSIFYATRSAAFVALTFSGTASAAGNPDTANIVAVQGNVGSCATAANSVQGMIQSGSNAPNVNPVLVGGWQNTSGTSTTIGHMAFVDSTFGSWLVGANNGIGASDGTQNYTGWSPVNTATQAGIWLDIPFGSNDDVQSPGNISRLKNSKKYGLMASPFWPWASTDSNGGTLPLSAYQGSLDAVNPAAGQLLLALNVGTAAGVMPYRVWLSCSAACDVIVNRVSNGGGSCTAATAHKAYDEGVGGVSSASLQTQPCTTVPTVINQIAHVYLAANTTQLLDLSGYWMKTNPRGFDFINNTNIAAGTVSINLEWAERT